MKVCFVNRKPRILGLCFGGKRLLPGKSEIELSEKEYRLVMKDEQLQSWLKLGWVAVNQPALEVEAAQPVVEEELEPDNKPEDALSGVGLDQARIMIAACSDPELLLAWHEKDRRKGAKEAIEARMKEIGAIEEEEKDLPEGVDEVFGD